MSIQDGISGVATPLVPTKHEVRCIEFPCTCITILQEKVKNLETGVYIVTQALNESGDREIQLREKLAKVESDKASNDRDYLELAAEANSLRKKVNDGLSCCCAGCTKHNLQIQEDKTAQQKTEDAYEQIKRTQALNQILKDIGVTIEPKPDKCIFCGGKGGWCSGLTKWKECGICEGRGTYKISCADKNDTL